MSENTIHANVDDHVMTITIDRPEKKNAITASMYARMNECLERASESDEIRVVIFRGQGEDLTSGNDLKDFQRVMEEDDDDPISAYHFVKNLALFDKLVVMAAKGYAVGLGATMLLHGDYVVAAEDAKIRFPFVDLGAVPEAGTSLLLPMMGGYQKAAELVFLAETVGPEKGYEVGFVNEVVPGEDLEDRAREIASRYAAKPPGAMQKTKAMMKADYRDRLEETIDREMEVFHERLFTEEAMEAIAAQLEGRDPDFS
jgi:enoyl-CoA hydratase/carnithine racemase